jgi:lantibiotic transport system permease protein
MNTLARVFLMEWRKQRGSLAAWLIVAGACFTPAAVLLVRLLRHDTLPRLYAHVDFWTQYWNSVWESMVVFLLPMGIILVTALLAQIEHRNGTWKQVSVLPVGQTTLYFAKLLVTALLIAQFLLLFVAAGTLGALLPAWLFADVPLPAAIDYAAPLREAARYYLYALPVLAAQFALSLGFANALVPVGAGFLAWVAALALLSWRYAYLVPYGQGIQHYMAQQPGAKLVLDSATLGAASVAMFVMFTAAGLLLFVTRAGKG